MVKKKAKWEHGAREATTLPPHKTAPFPTRPARATIPSGRKWRKALCSYGPEFLGGKNENPADPDHKRKTPLSLAC